MGITIEEFKNNFISYDYFFDKTKSYVNSENIHKILIESTHNFILKNENLCQEFIIVSDEEVKDYFNL